MDDIREALQAYVNDRLEPGGFLLAVLENDLKEACARADHTNRTRIFEIVQYIYNRVPAVCWGSPEKVAKWLGEEKGENS